MAKIDELVALMTEEIDDFKSSVNRMEQLVRDSANIKIEPDTTRLIKLIGSHLSRTQKLFEDEHSKLELISSKLDRASFYPAWFTKIAIGLLFVLMLFAGYGFFILSSAKNKEQAAYESGKTETWTYFKEFLKDEPESLEAYKKWINN